MLTLKKNCTKVVKLFCWSPEQVLHNANQCVWREHVVTRQCYQLVPSVVTNMYHRSEKQNKIGDFLMRCVMFVNFE